MYSETTGAIHALKCVINVTVNNRGKCEFNSFHGVESNPNCQPHHCHQTMNLYWVIGSLDIPNQTKPA